MIILLPLLLAVSTLVRADNAVFARERNGMIHLRTDGSYPARFIIDYGQDITGFPTLNVVHAIGNTSLFSVAHSESRELLNQLHVSAIVASHSVTSRLLKSRVMDQLPCLLRRTLTESNTTTYPRPTPPTHVACSRVESDGRFLRSHLLASLYYQKWASFHPIIRLDREPLLIARIATGLTYGVLALKLLL